MMIQKQTNHLINEINKSDMIDDKLIGCASIILVGLCYRDEKKYLTFILLLLISILTFNCTDELDITRLERSKNAPPASDKVKVPRPPKALRVTLVHPTDCVSSKLSI